MSINTLLAWFPGPPPHPPHIGECVDDNLHLGVCSDVVKAHLRREENEIDGHR